MFRTHKNDHFRCAECNFATTNRFELFVHLEKTHHLEGYPDDELLEKYIDMPRDLRKIMCLKCSDMDALENGQWLCRDPKQVNTSYHIYFLFDLEFLLFFFFLTCTKW